MPTFTQECNTTRNAGYKWPGTYWHWYYTDSEVGKANPAGSINFALRFTNVSIPPGSTIVSAKLSLMCWFASGKNIYTKIYGIDEDNTALFPTEQNGADVPTDRTPTTAFVDWDRAGGLPDDVYADTADFTAVVQEIIDRGGWASGNAMGFVIKDDGFANDEAQYVYNYDRWGSGYNGKYPVLTIEYTEPAHQVYKTLAYKVRYAPATIEKPLTYCVREAEDTVVPFVGIKVAKDNVNVLNTNNPHRLKYSSQFNTLKYFESNHVQLHVVGDPFEEVVVSGYIEHNLGYFPFAQVYATDELMGTSGYQPLGRWQLGSGAYRAYYFYVTTTRLYFVAKGYGESGVDFYVDFYYNLFINNLNL
jgi:hypothetical protein